MRISSGFPAIFGKTGSRRKSVTPVLHSAIDSDTDPDADPEKTAHQQNITAQTSLRRNPRMRNLYSVRSNPPLFILPP
jgi:hypothetical protein